MLVPVILAVLVAVAALTARLGRAADDCISQPNSAAPQGSHWYYRVDRTANRRCWFLGAEGAKVRVASPKRLPSAKPSPHPTEEIDAGVTPVSMSHGNADDRTTVDSQDDMPLIWPILTPADLAAAEQPTISVAAEQASDQTPESAAAAWRPHESVVWSDMPAITAGVLVLVTIIFGTIYKLFAAEQRQRHRPTHRDHQPPAANVARPRKLVSLALASTVATEHQADVVREPVATSRRLGVARKPRDSGDVSRDIDDDFLQRLKWLRRAA